MRKIVMGMLLLGLALLSAACNGDQPPTQIVVVTATSEPSTLAPPAPTVISALPSSPTPLETNTSTTPDATSSPAASLVPTQTTTPSPSPTALPDMFPTVVKADLQIAEQVFEHGRMIWLRHNRQIWVMQAASDDPNSGDWFCYYDTFQEGESEIDPALRPPENMYQPRRGFGKLWRTNSEIKAALGWALTPEFDLTSNYTYLAGGTVTGEQYTPGPGEHRLTTLYNETISFFEETIRGDCLGGTWHLTP